MAMTTGKRLPVVDESKLSYEHPLYEALLSAPGLSVATTAIDRLLEWGAINSLWMFPMATSCCAIEFMSAAASRVDLDRMGTIPRATPRQTDVMVIAGTITVKMAPRVKALWEQMPEPKWAIAMGSCAISGDFYRNLYSVIPGVDTVVPVDVYVPGCPPNPEALMHGLLRLQEKVRLRRTGKLLPPDPKPHALDLTRPTILRVDDPERDPSVSLAQEESAMTASSLDRSDECVKSTEVAEVPAPRGPRTAGDDDLDALFRDHGVTETPKDASAIVPIERHVSLARHLRDAGFLQLVYIVATHFPEKTGAKPSPERFEVAYSVRSVGKGTRLASWRVGLSPGEAVPSLVGVYAGADWQEREQFDLVGISFAGHPDLRRIMLPDSWSGHPLRKDYAADTACPPWR